MFHVIFVIFKLNSLVVQVKLCCIWYFWIFFCFFGCLRNQIDVFNVFNTTGGWAELFKASFQYTFFPAHRLTKSLILKMSNKQKKNTAKFSMRMKLKKRNKNVNYWLTMLFFFGFRVLYYAGVEWWRPMKYARHRLRYKKLRERNEIIIIMVMIVECSEAVFDVEKQVKIFFFYSTINENRSKTNESNKSKQSAEKSAFFSSPQPAEYRFELKRWEEEKNATKKNLLVRERM